MMIELQGLCKAYHGQPVLQNLSWRIQTGESWRIAGASGIGKTTLLRLLMGLEKPDSGSVLGMDNVKIGAVFQEDRLCPWMSAVKNLQFACSVSTEQATEALCELLPEHVLHQPVSEFSAGMRQRVCWIRAILSQSDLLLLDEPFAGVDPENIRKMLAFLSQHRHGRTVIMVTHDQTTLTDADKVLFLSD